MEQQINKKSKKCSGRAVCTVMCSIESAAVAFVWAVLLGSKAFNLQPTLASISTGRCAIVSSWSRLRGLNVRHFNAAESPT